MKKIIISAITAAALATSAIAATSMTLYGVKGPMKDNEHKAVKVLIEEAAKLGFELSDPHERINDGYKTKYGSTKLDTLNFMSVTNDKVINKIAAKYPQIGGFSPFNLYSYKMLAEDTTWVGHLSPEMMLDIVGINDKATRAEFIKHFEPLDAAIKKTMGNGTDRKVEFNKLPAEPLMTFEYKIPADADIADWVEEWQEKYEELFEERKYIIAGFKNMVEAWDDLELDHHYDQFFVYSLCHFGFSNAIFNTTPEAGAFAPCSMYCYVDQGTRTMYVGMPKLEAWMAATNITDKKQVKLILDLDKEIIQTMNDLKD
jgi:hypothetical protein